MRRLFWRIFGLFWAATVVLIVAIAWITSINFENEKLPIHDVTRMDLALNDELRSAQRAFRENGLEAMKQRMRDMQRFAISIYVLDAQNADVLERSVPPEVLDAAKNPLQDSEGFHYNRLRVRKINNTEGKPVYTAVASYTGSPLLRMLSIAAAASTITSLGYAINVAAGQTRRLVLSAAFALPVTVIAVWLGARRGPIGVAENLAAVNVLLLLPRLWWALRDLPGGLSGYTRALMGPIISTAAITLGLSLGKISAANSIWSTRLIVSAAAGFAGLVLLALLWPRVRDEWRTVIGYLPHPWQKPPPRNRAT